MTSPRLPADLSPPRMDALARLPVFLALEGRRAVVAGGNAQAAWKVELLSAAGAHVEVFAAAPTEEIVALAKAPSQGPVAIHRRAVTADDLTGAAVAVGAFDDDGSAAQFAAAARARGVPVNVIDRPAFCDFAFGAIVNRSPLIIGISTGGAAPAFGMTVRAKIEAMIPRGFARWVEAARQWRTALAATGLSFQGRRQFWQFFSHYAATHPNREPAQSDFDAFLAATTNEGPNPDSGSVTLVGAGPGDPELLTLRAVRALQAADIILVDDLVAPDILDFARREAKKMLVGKTGHGPSCKQEEINALMVTLAKAGKRVVRLKGGDPMIFGRATEEIAACRAAGVAVEVVPGVSAAQGAASRLGVSLTHRETARRVQYVTGHGADGRLPADIDWPSIADPGATTVVYMPVKTHAAFVTAAITAGLEEATPAVAVINATRPDEVVITATVAELPGRLAAAAVAGPALVMIGRVFGSMAAVTASDSDSADGNPPVLSSRGEKLG
jgi:uroporphyrin-III C-methyltransferase / precorrin-2 dehydrogenase / sirohydrochlorin ferrochelatase